MFERERKLYPFMLQYLRMLTKDIDESQLSLQPSEGVNPPVWILGHLAVTNDYGLRLLGKQSLCPKDWQRNFGMGSTPGKNDTPYPTKKELLDFLDSASQQLLDAAQYADADAVAQPHGSEFFQNTPLETIADTVAHLMTTHIGLHLGQLSAWRRQVGFPHMF